MFFDFNVPYTAAGFVLGGPAPAGVLERVEKCVVHGCYIPYYLAKAVMHIALTALLGLTYALTMFRSNFIGNHFAANGVGFLECLCLTPVSVIGLFAPINAGNWNHRFNNPFRY